MKNRRKIIINNIRIGYSAGRDHDEAALKKATAQIKKSLGAKPYNLRISKKSIDARKKAEISFVYAVYAEIESSASPFSSENASDIKQYTEEELTLTYGNEALVYRPIIVGFGPAGMFAGLILAEHGYRPIILERGGSIDERIAAVESFTEKGILNTETNIQFGAGGAGTFSDGKLTTRINDPLIAYVLQKLNELGADDDILYKAKPHIGTDVLRSIVKEADKVITSLGGEIRYNTKASDIRDNRIKAGDDELLYNVLILATGHSARDTYGELINKSFVIEPKSFSVGVRIEHLQSDIDTAMFGEHAGDKTLGHAEYQLSYRRGDRGCYTFCMCPGGTVVPSASEEFGVVTNGMSVRARDGKNANAAVCVSVKPEDYGSNPASAIEFQRRLEQEAYKKGGSDYSAPMQTVGDFLSGKQGTEYTKVIPSYRNAAVTPSDFNDIFPAFVTDMLKSGLNDFSHKIKGYADPHIPMTGVETRTSAPVRILRGDDLTAIGHPGIYPCGEGAGYAGGIVSAAVDGIRIASKIISRYKPY